MAVYAHEDGTYHMSPLDYTGTILRDVTLMQTDLVSCGCALYPLTAADGASNSAQGAVAGSFEHVTIGISVVLSGLAKHCSGWYSSCATRCPLLWANGSALRHVLALSQDLGQNTFIVSFIGAFIAGHMPNSSADIHEIQDTVGQACKLRMLVTRSLLLQMRLYRSTSIQIRSTF